MNVYYDWRDRIMLSEKYGVSFAEWMNDPLSPFRFAIHPDGFWVFLRPAEILKLDEYLESDPYGMEFNQKSVFNRQRIRLTLTLLGQVIKEISKPAKILDVACGEGHITAAIQQMFPRTEIFAFDGSISAISRASQIYSGITFGVADVKNPPYPPDYFDCIICNNIWEHVPDPVSLIKKVARSLKQNGFLIVSTPSRYNLSNLLRIILGKQVVLASMHHVTEYSVGQVLEQLSYAGFNVEGVEGDLLKPEQITVKSVIKYYVGILLGFLLKLSQSHHKLGPTVFYLARKSN